LKIKHFFDPNTFTLTYVVSDEKTRDSVIIDPVLDYDPDSGKVCDHALKEVVEYINANSLNILGILETHAHADHLSSSQLLKQLFPEAKIAISEKIRLVQDVFKTHFNLTQLLSDGSQFDRLLKDFEEVSWGSLKMRAIPTPGHTPACMSFQFENVLFTGDALFMPDYGTGRCDFPKGSARQLFESITKNLYTLPDETRVFVGHDYSPHKREMRFETTIGESKIKNIQLSGNTKEAEFIEFREKRDRTLKAPRLLLPSIQININAGHLPAEEENGKAYLKIPLKVETTLLTRLKE
jgi:glyoxylase-like metal-dependent hydrolase (beta-lactamase superfamily II)